MVIGSGPAGEKGAAKAAYFGKKVALVEQAPSYGGAVANTGVPTKGMRETALYVSGFQQRDLHGLNLTCEGPLTIDRFMHRGRAVRQALDQSIGANLERHHIDVHHGRATFVDAYTVKVEGVTEPRLLEAGVILIATGSMPRRPAAIPFAAPAVYDSDTIQHMERLPRSLAIAGGGTIGCEYACLFKVLGLDEVRVIHSGERILPFADDEISTILRELMVSLGIEFHMPDALERVDATPVLKLQLRSGKQLESEALLVALGRRSNVAGLRLENTGVQLDEHGQLRVNERFQTNVPHIYAAGDVIGGHALASTAMAGARMAMDHAFPLGGHFGLNDVKAGLKSSVNSFLPIGIWTIPEISMVGETEQGLRSKGVAHAVGRCRYDANPRGMLIAERRGLLKLLFSLPDEKLCGVHAIGDDACELIAAGLVAMTLGATCSTFIDTCFNYPSLSDLYKYAAYDALGCVDRGDVYRPWAPPRAPRYPQARPPLT
ncbi:MAG TPA: FAD-dependent oxidoreductase [Verrucomicrobiae bacterium]|nr:FAD-dependent oxidoreductase [Verrucomicrobiae bacterium]